MKIRLILIILMATCSMASAQQQGIYSQVQNGAMFYNPAFAGLEYGGILSLGHRTQWAGINAS
ncbi:MAG: type IX secretion system membrane protein PorP/SprF, partial [Bacteroidia bacterium]